MSSESFDIPVVLFFFNRPDKTMRVFDKIRALKPQTLFLISDKAQSGDFVSAEKNENCKLSLEHIDWRCDVHHIYSSIHLGCGKRISSGLELVFEQVDKAIILEDDVVPDSAFFDFCRTLLLRYESETTVFSINGFSPIEQREREGYYFSHYFLPPWGWATWRDRWSNYDFKVDDTDFFSRPYISKPEYWKTLLLENSKELKTWDIQVNSCLWKFNQVTIFPFLNLVSNIGFDEEATFTKQFHDFARRKTNGVNHEIVHPKEIRTEFDLEVEEALISWINAIK